MVKEIVHPVDGYHLRAFLLIFWRFGAIMVQLNED